MARIIIINGVSYLYPETGDENWGDDATNAFDALAANTLQKIGGTFTLTNDVNFGANFGLVSSYFKSRTNNIATNGVLRLANADNIAWRNNANAGNLLLVPNTSDRLTFNGIELVDVSSVQTISNKTLSNITFGTPTQTFNALSPLTTKGDLIGFDGTNNIRFASGSNGQVLVVDNSTSSGLRWSSVGVTSNAYGFLFDGTNTASAVGNDTIRFRSSDGSVSAVVGNNDPTFGDNVNLTVNQSVINLANVSGTLPINKGGTGQTTSLLAFNALSPLTTKGDLISYDGTNNIRFGVGTNGQVLVADSTTASGLRWGNATNSLAALTDVSLSSPTINQVLTYNGSVWVNQPVSGGTVTSVGATSASSLLSITGSPITGSGTLTFTINQANFDLNSLGGTLAISKGGTGTTGIAAGVVISNGVSLSSVASLVAGSNTQVQFNNSGTFGASSNFTWNNGTNTLSASNVTIPGTLNTTKYNETSQVVSISGGNLSLNLANGTFFQVTLNQNITNISFSNVAPSGSVSSITILFVGDGTARSVTWGSSIRFAYGITPVLTSTLNKVDIITMITRDGGTNWFAFITGQEF